MHGLSFDSGSQRVQLAVTPQSEAAIVEALMAIDHAADIIDRADLLENHRMMTLSGDPLIVELTLADQADGIPGIGKALSGLAERTGLVVGATKLQLDSLAPALDVPGAELICLDNIASELEPAIARCRANAGVGERGTQDPFSSIRDDMKQLADRLTELAGALDPGGPVGRQQTELARSEHVRRVISERRLRTRYLPAELFADPAWDILLDLTHGRFEHRQTSVSSLCIAANVPTTTALRWIRALVENGTLVRTPDPVDARRAYIDLSDHALEAMCRYLDAAIAAG